MMNENEISYIAIGAAIEIHRCIGPGLLESAYESALAFELRNMGLNIKQQVPMPFVYKGIKQQLGYRLDIVINEKVIIELKAVESLVPVHFAQLLTYLKSSGLKLGLLINFNSKILKGSIHRVVNDL